ncbi:MAG: glycosyltransferase [Casimicrobiaceae bacterium]
MKRVLMIAFHFPPLNVSSGIQRTLRFAQYLPAHGWEPLVLTAHPRAYSSVSPQHGLVASSGPLVRRAFALDSSRHLSIAGWHPRWLSLPDRWWSWWLGAVPAGLELIRKFKPDALWSTYPIATAHLIGRTLQQRTGIPWVADFRDPMAQSDYPADRLAHRAFEWIEQRTLEHCKRAVFTAPGARTLYVQRYPDIPAERLTVIENGFDESAFAGAEEDSASKVAGSGAARPGAGSNAAPATQRPLVLVHSGTIYLSERDPLPFFNALAGLSASGDIGPATLKVVLRATGCDDHLRALIERMKLDEMVKIEPTVDYRAALSEMLNADGLLVLQAANCNFQVPAKLYEYLRARRPILALTDPAGDTAAVLRRAGIDTIAPLDSQSAIADLLLRFIDLVRERRAPLADAATLAGASREARTVELAAVLERAVA